MSNFYSISKLKQFIDGASGVITEGILDSYEQATTKNGKPYIKGIIRDKSETITFKVWDYTLDSFMKKNDLIRGNTYVVQINGDFSYYEGEPQMVARPFNNGLILAKLINITYDEYIDKSYYPAKVMLASIRSFVERMHSPDLKEICKTVLNNYGEKLMYYPYSENIHSEKGGLLAHIYNCISRVVNCSGEPKYKDEEGKDCSVINKEIVITTILVYNLTPLHSYNVEQKTATILAKNEYRNALLGERTGNIIYGQQVIYASCPKHPFTSGEVLNVMHGVIALNSDVPCATLEAQTAYNIVNSEISEHLVFSNINGIYPGEISKQKIDGIQRCFVNYNIPKSRDFDNENSSGETATDSEAVPIENNVAANTAENAS